MLLQSQLKVIPPEASPTPFEIKIKNLDSSLDRAFGILEDFRSGTLPEQPKANNPGSKPRAPGLHHFFNFLKKGGAGLDTDAPVEPFNLSFPDDLTSEIGQYLQLSISAGFDPELQLLHDLGDSLIKLHSLPSNIGNDASDISNYLRVSAPSRARLLSFVNETLRSSIALLMEIEQEGSAKFAQYVLNSTFSLCQFSISSDEEGANNLPDHLRRSFLETMSLRETLCRIAGLDSSCAGSNLFYEINHASESDSIAQQMVSRLLQHIEARRKIDEATTQ